jgi:DNA-binding MarR family transcriptional regulator
MPLNLTGITLVLSTVAVGSALATSSRARRPFLLLIVWMSLARSHQESVLDHFRRGALHQVIRENPGIHFAELRRKTGIPHGSAIHHLRALETAGIIRAVPTGRYTRFFTVINEVDEASYHLSPSDALLLEAVERRPGMSLGELAATLNRHKSNTSTAVTRLSYLGFITTEQHGRRRFIFPRSIDRGRPLPSE